MRGPVACINSVVERIASRPVKDAVQAIETHDAVSFDVFDTLINRACGTPTAVFDIVGARVGVPELSALRAAARGRAEARLGAWLTIADIYGQLALDNPSLSGLVPQLLEEEVKVELEQCVANVVVAEVFKRICLSERTVLLISDMYLPSWTIKEMLSQAGYDTTGVSLYVSCEYGKTKRRGDLYDVALNEEGVNEPSSVLHIGDSFFQDVIMAKKRGLDAFLLRRQRCVW